MQLAHETRADNDVDCDKLSFIATFQDNDELDNYFEKWGGYDPIRNMTRYDEQHVIASGVLTILCERRDQEFYSGMVLAFKCFDISIEHLVDRDSRTDRF